MRFAGRLLTYLLSPISAPSSIASRFYIKSRHLPLSQCPTLVVRSVLYLSLTELDTMHSNLDGRVVITHRSTDPHDSCCSCVNNGMLHKHRVDNMTHQVPLNAIEPIRLPDNVQRPARRFASWESASDQHDQVEQFQAHKDNCDSDHHYISAYL